MALYLRFLNNFAEIGEAIKFRACPASPWTFDRFREEMTRPRLNDFEMR
jgi:hypothetical protein